MSGDNPSTDDILAKLRGGGTPAPAKAETPAAAEATPAAESPAPAAGGSPLDQIRAGGAGGGKAEEASKKPTAGMSPLDAIRAGGAAGGDKAKADTPKPAGGSPLDQIRAGGGGAKKPAAGGSPLDQIRAGAGGGGAAKPAAAPAAAKAAPVDTAKAAGMSAAEMIEAARKGVVTADPVTGKPKNEAPKKVALPKKPLPGKAAPKKPATEPRRDFLAMLLGIIASPLVWAWGSLVAATAASSLAIARFMMPNVLVEPPTKFKIGPPTDYGPGTVSTKWKAQYGVWIINAEVDGEPLIYALSTVCTHLGCTPNWLEGEQKFKCPCHGSGFYKTGVNFEGPAPRPLERHGIRLAEDGMLEVDKSIKFQKELGQWENGASFVSV